MNNQFATQFLLSEVDAYDSLRSMLAQLGAGEDSIEMLVKAVEMGALKPSEAVEIVKKALNVHETSAVGGGVTGGPTAATFTAGAGEQVAGSKKAFKKKYQESTFEDKEIAVFDGGEDGLTKVYRKADGSYYGVNDEFDFTARDMQELSHKLAMWGYKHLSGTFYEDAPRLAGNPSKTTKQGAKNLSAYSSVGFTKAPNAQEAGKKMKSIDVKMLWKEGEEPAWEGQVEPLAKALADRNIPRNLHAEFFDYLKEKLANKELKQPQDVFDATHHFLEMLRETLNESRAYSKFKKEAGTRTKDQQMHEAVKMIHNRLTEVSRILEYAQQMRNELSEGEQTLEYNHNTKKMFERINSKVVEIYSKTRQLK